MKKKYGLAVAGCCALSVALAVALLTDSQKASLLGATLPAATANTLHGYGQLPMAFERNEGQTDAEVEFLARGAGYGLFLTRTEAVLSLHGAGAKSAVVRMSLAGASPTPTLEGAGLQQGRSHYFSASSPDKWQRDVARYDQVRYRGVYPGIDLVYYGNQQQLEYDFIVAPGRDPGRIAIEFDGAESMKLDRAGNLVLETSTGSITQHKPVLYQEIDGQRRGVAGHYRLLGDNRVGFEIAKYDATRPLVIDPVLAYLSYFGGSGDDGVTALAVDKAGNLYATGTTASTNFPLRDAPQAANRGNGDAFVTKFNADGNGLVYSTFLGGNGADKGTGIAVDASGNAYVTGQTKSANFPVLAAAQSAHGGQDDAFVAKLNANGALAFSTYLGGSAADQGLAIGLDRSGNIYVAGATASSNFPRASALDGSLGGSLDGFLTRLNASGALSFSTYFGGAGNDQINGMVVDKVTTRPRAVYLTGETSSSDFPVSSSGAIQSTLQGGADAFVTVLNPLAGAPFLSLGYSSYLGSANADSGNAIDVDAGGKAIVVGRTAATSSAPFISRNAWQPTPAGGVDGFAVGLTLLDAGTLVFSTYIGGTGDDEIKGVAVDGLETAYFIGTTNSTNLRGPLPAYGLQVMNGGGQDAFAGRYSLEGELYWSSYLGGSGTENGQAIALYGLGNIFVGGSTASTNLQARVPYQTTNAGGVDSFITRYGVRSARTNARNLNGDRTDDILWQNGRKSVIWRSAASNQVQPVTDQVSDAWKIAGTGDFNADLRADILWRNSSTGENAIWRGGFSADRQPIQAVTNLQWQVAGIGDFNFDTKSDILWRNGVTGANVIWLSGNGATQQKVTAVTNVAWKVAGVGDFDGDFHFDILWRNASTGANVIWRSGSSATQQPVARVPDLSWKVVGVGDFLGDGKSDILWRNGTTGANAIWSGGDHLNQQPISRVNNTDYAVAAVGDYNGDGRSDILWRNGRTGANVIWRSASMQNPQAVGSVTVLDWKVVP